MKVSLVLTHQCNLACGYCYAGEKFKRSMTLETGYRSLLLAFSRPGPVEVSFFGGEPMIAFDVLAQLTRTAARWAKRQGRSLRFALTTNATILKEKHLRFLRHYDFFVGFSLDGLEEVQDRQRPFVNGRGSGALVWRNLEAAAEVLPDFRVMMVVRPESLAGLLPAVERLYRLGVSKVSLLPETFADWRGHEQHLSEVYGRLAQICYASLHTDEPLLLSPFVEQLLPAQGGCGGRAACDFGLEEMAISPAGNFYPCARLVGPDRRPEVRIGNLQQGVDVPKVMALRQDAEQAMSGCGSGGCQCLAHMPGDRQAQLQHLALFTGVTSEVCLQAQRMLEEVAA